MENKQNADKGMIVGIDISKYNVQVSCLPYKSMEAETISTQVGVEKYEIPLCLFKKLDSDVWYYGDKARLNRYSKEGVYVEDLWEGTLGNREMMMEDETYSYEQFMTVFMEKILKLVSQSGYTEEIGALVFTTDDMNYDKIMHLRAITQSLPIDDQRIFFIDYKESFGAYTTAGKKELWNHDVFLFHYTGRNLKAFQLRVNQKTLPFQIKVGEIDFGELDYGKDELEASESAREEMDSRFLATVEEVFGKKIVSTVYLIGDGFLVSWMKDSLRVLCRGRRVFQGNNLFTKGACYAGRWYLNMQKPVGEYKSQQMLACDVRIPVAKQGEKQGYLYAAKSGEPWYHAGMEAECVVGLSEDEQSTVANKFQIQIEMIAALGGEKAEKIELLELEEFPKRPPKASKIGIKVDFVNEHTGRIVVEDRGFGEFYPASGLKWEKQFHMDMTTDTQKEVRV